ncbi:transmembrane protein [Paramarasmius palmivorus]|uniref:Transmembrane protein n=1 Tax=Paramarasmius palmivorus TaxID=297713 RepID=A0AAW0D0F6_9AGAR
MFTDSRRTRARRSSSVTIHTIFDKPNTNASIVRVRATSVSQQTPATSQRTLLSKFIASQRELESYQAGKPVRVDGETVSIAAVTAAARYHASVELDQSSTVRERLDKSRAHLSDKVNNGISIYGVSTGFGGSADTRTDSPLVLGHALLQMQHAGVLPSSTKPLEALPLLDPIGSTVMPEAWVRGAILIRMNSLIRGHSGVRWELVEKMNQLLAANITPVIPLRGSISASGDLSPLSYIAGTLCANPSIRVFDGEASFGARQIVSSRDALASHHIEPLALASKEHLGILNGTAFSAAVASLAMNDAVHLALLSQVLTAMGVEALKGTRGPFDPFIHNVARPHPGQVECAKNIWDLLEGSKFAILEEKEVTIAEDEGTLRQDRYSLRTAPQFIGPQIEDLLASLATITQECNSTTDNPLIDGETGKVHNGGNFQAMAVTNSMEKTRLALHHLGKILFAQCAELMDNSMNRGLPPSLAATDPSLNYFGKGIDIATAAYVGELGYLAAPVSTHIQSAEMHNQAVNSLALISCRATINSLEVLSILIASYCYVLCQALDLRALEVEFKDGVQRIVREELSITYNTLSYAELSSLTAAVFNATVAGWESTSSMDATARMQKIGSTNSTVLLDFFTREKPDDISALASIPKFRQTFATRATSLLNDLRSDYLTGKRGQAPASSYLNKTKPLYEFVRKTLGIKMHGLENLQRFPNGHGVDAQTSGQDVSLIHEAIRDGRMQPVIVSMFA